jgi:hypothetical protein
MVSEMVGEKAAKDLNLVALSNDTVKKANWKNFRQRKKQLIEIICKTQYYSLQVDESTDFANKSHLLCYVRGKNYWRFIILPLFDTYHCYRGVQQFEWISDVKCNSMNYIHRESLATKKITEELKKILNESVRIVNFS